MTLRTTFILYTKYRWSRDTETDPGIPVGSKRRCRRELIVAL